MGAFTMPSLGADMDVGTVTRWLVRPGDTVHRGDVVAVVDTEKSEIEVEVFEDGTVAELVVPEGREVPVGTVLARIAPAPAAAGPGSASAPASPAPEVSGPGAAEDRTARLRHAVGSLVARSKREIPHYYLATTIDLSRARAWLDDVNASRPVTGRLVMSALLLAATARAVAAVPEVNGTFTAGAFTASPSVHLGVAISLRGGGLVVPAIREAQDRTLDELLATLRDLVGRARTGVLRASDLAGPTLTVTNLGDRGVDLVHGVIFPPQVALVGFGRVAERPMVADGQVVARTAVTATLAADHRVSDGRRGGRYLAEIDRLLQRPDEL
ncbi:MAG: 2-oxo acid dehydrogenase subunit E2 [Actinomycetota bacterium]|jgi:pyruvate dehydrogenase E2 component (dihydrolipoamide acetyltransferase)|nr:2-oxo acid dehydrogenase subunit E2 [Actinomycetota bacterium]